VIGGRRVPRGALYERRVPQVGDAVIGSDRGKIGEVEEVVTPDGEKPGHLRVPRGVILEYRSHVPTGLRS
jgi:hypothetical protein